MSTFAIQRRYRSAVDIIEAIIFKVRDARHAVRDVLRHPFSIPTIVPYTHGILRSSHNYRWRRDAVRRFDWRRAANSVVSFTLLSSALLIAGFNAHRSYQIQHAFDGHDQYIDSQIADAKVRFNDRLARLPIEDRAWLEARKANPPAAVTASSDWKDWPSASASTVTLNATPVALYGAPTYDIATNTGVAVHLEALAAMAKQLGAKNPLAQIYFKAAKICVDVDMPHADCAPAMEIIAQAFDDAADAIGDGVDKTSATAAAAAKVRTEIAALSEPMAPAKQIIVASGDTAPTHIVNASATKIAGLKSVAVSGHHVSKLATTLRKFEQPRELAVNRPVDQGAAKSKIAKKSPSKAAGELFAAGRPSKAAWKMDWGSQSLGGG